MSAEDQALDAAKRHAALPRLQGRGYQGGIRVRRVLPVVEVDCDDGEVRYIEPRETGFAFVRDRIEIGSGKPWSGLSLGALLRTAAKLAGLGVLVLAAGFLCGMRLAEEDRPPVCDLDHGWMRCPVTEGR